MEPLRPQDVTRALESVADLLGSGANGDITGDVEFRPADSGLHLVTGEGKPCEVAIESDGDYNELAAVCNHWLQGERERRQLRADNRELQRALSSAITRGEGLQQQFDGISEVIDSVRPGMQERSLLEATLCAVTGLEAVECA